MNSLARLIRILDLFDASPGLQTAEQLHAALGYSRSTLYRYLKVLTDAGLLASFHGDGYSLGPRIVELNALIMTRDPLILATLSIMETLAIRYHGTALLCRRFKDRVLCVHQIADEGACRPSFEIGRSRHLTQGASSRIILANLGSAMVRRFYLADPGQFAESGLGQDLNSVRRTLRKMRETAYLCEPCLTGNGALAIAAPIVDGGATVIGSLTLLVPESSLSLERLETIGATVARSAEEAGQAIS